MVLYKLVFIPDDHIGFAVVLSKDLCGSTTATKNIKGLIYQTLYSLLSLLSRFIRKYSSKAVALNHP